MASHHPHILVVDGYPKADRKNLAASKMSLAGDLYVKMLGNICPSATFDIVYPSDGDAALPTKTGLADYDGVAWTGCSLTIHDEKDLRVARHLSLSREAFKTGVPQYGTCWGIQIAAVAAGGTVGANPHGREMGIARKISLTATGRGHPLFNDKPSTFDGYVSHFDEVTHLPSGAEVLAGNAFTRVQALSVIHDKGTFWGLQYHPEYNLFEMARLIHCRRETLTQEGFFHDDAEALSLVTRYEHLHQHPTDQAEAWQLGIESDLLLDNVRQTEARNWMFHHVLAKRG